VQTAIGGPTIFRLLRSKMLLIQVVRSLM
jgi:hypothetical protein